MTAAETRDAIKAKAEELGFDAVGFTEATLPASVNSRFESALAKGYHGTMAWLENRLTQRTHPQRLWPDARTVVMLGMSYGPDHDPMKTLARRDIGNISVYARGDDYHDLIKKRLKAIGRWMSEQFRCELKVFVDTAPVAEKPLGQKAGIGWQGKHTNLVSREHGSWLFLGAIFTTLELPVDDEEQDHCGSCNRCLEVCPTDAFPRPYQLDARRCISYLTIEHKGPIPEEFRSSIGNRIYGCDDCLAVCPWNKFAQQGREQKLAARGALTEPPLRELAALDDQGFRRLFSKSPVKRVGRDRFVRNVAIATGNSGDPTLLSSVIRLQTDSSDVVRDAATWARRQLEKIRC